MKLIKRTGYQMFAVSLIIVLLWSMGFPGSATAADQPEERENIAVNTATTKASLDEQEEFKETELIKTGLVKHSDVEKSVEMTEDHDVNLSNVDIDFTVSPERISQWELARSGFEFTWYGSSGRDVTLTVGDYAFQLKPDWLFRDFFVLELDPGTYPVTAAVGNVSDTENLIVESDDDYWGETTTPHVTTGRTYVLTKSEAETQGAIRVEASGLQSYSSHDIFLNGDKLGMVYADWGAVAFDIDIGNLPIGDHTVEITHPTGSGSTTFSIVPDNHGISPSAGVFEGLTYQYMAGSTYLDNPWELPIRFEVDENGMLKNAEIEYWWVCVLADGQSGFNTAKNLPPTKITVGQPFQIDWDDYGDYSIVGVINEDGTASGKFISYGSGCGNVAADWDLASDQDPVSRIQGDNRMLTAVEVSKQGWERADTVILSRADNFADALAGVPFAYKLDAPILLTTSTRLNAGAKGEIQRLGAKEVVILGGPQAISTSVENELKAAGLNVRRIDGGTRFETAALIADEISPNGANDIIIANGMDFPDALSVASYAAREGLPILLTTDTTVPRATNEAINDLNAKSSVVIGGPNAVPENVKNQLPNPTRWGGNDRYQTNVIINENSNLNTQSMYVATGQNYADALTGAVLAAKRNTSILLVHQRVPAVVADYIQDHNLIRLSIFGGDVAISKSVENELENLLK